MDLFVLVGEPSGDVHAAKLLEKLLEKKPGLKIGAVAGPQMRKLPIECIEPMEKLQVMGFFDVALALPKIAQLFFSVRKLILSRSPKVFLGVDYPDFNLRMHRSLKKHGFLGKCVHYICPTVWAWRKGRIRMMEQCLDELLTILPFEPGCFARTKLPVHYVGHPLVQAVRRVEAKTPAQKLLALFPGSRKHEIERNLPTMLAVAKKLKTQDAALQVAISVASSELESLVKTMAPDALLVKEAYDLMRQAHLALAKSGTVVLELALHQTPTVVQYAIKPWDLFLARRVFRIRLPHYSLPNLLLQESVFPELFGPYLTEKNVYEAAEGLWFDEGKRVKCKEGCRKVWDVLGTGDANEVAAERLLATF